MYKLNFKILYLIFYIFFEGTFFLNIFVKSKAIQNIEKDVAFLDSQENEKFNIFKDNSLKNILKIKLFDSNNKLVNLILDNEEKNKKELAIEIISDVQYQEANMFYAEGNVEANLKNGKLKADKLTYDRTNNNLVIEGNISYEKGNQFLEASYLNYSFKDKRGYLEDVYGVLDIDSINQDLGFKFKDEDKVEGNKFENNIVSDIKYKGSANIGLENTFEEGNKLNLTDLKFEVPQINKWRFKTNKISIDDNILLSDNILFTNDPFNRPQFYLKSKKFSVNTVKDKLKFISKNTWLNFDDKFNFPIGRRSIIDRDPISRWGIGSDNEEKDGFYISRGFNTRKILEKYDLKITPYLLIQRAIKGKTNTFVLKDSSILSKKVTQDISFADFFAINASLQGEIKSWELNINSDLNSLDLEKLSQAARFLITLDKSINLNKNNLYTDTSNKYLNFLDFRLYGAYRKKVIRSFSGDEEIYLGKGFTLSNRREWQRKNFNNKLSLNYDLGEFEAKEKNINNLKTSIRNVFSTSYENQLFLWRKKNLDKQIDISYKYSPNVIQQGLSWASSVKSGVFFYGDGSQQKAISFSTGPEIILGSFKKKFNDYTNLNLSVNYNLKDGESPFAFDDVDKTQKLKISLEQQIIGPLLFGYEGFLNLDNNSDNYSQLTNSTYTLDIKRRAYSIGAFYKESSQAFGIQFNLNNFNYFGKSSKF